MAAVSGSRPGRVTRAKRRRSAPAKRRTRRRRRNVAPGDLRLLGALETVAVLLERHGRVLELLLRQPAHVPLVVWRGELDGLPRGRGH